MGVERFRRVILVTGTPGVGKSSVSCLLASRLGGVCVSLAELVEREGLVSGVDEVRGTLVADMGGVSKRVREILEGSEGDIIVDGHYAVDVVAAEDVFVVFVLRRDPKELRDVLEGRGFREGKLWENLAAEILDVCLWDAVSACGSDRVCEVDVSGKKVEDVVDEVVLVLEGKKKCRVGIVDWLGKLEEEGRLHEFLKSF